MKRCTPTRWHNQHRARGFTLTEVAIVLGVMVLILSGIWALGGSVWKNYKVYKAMDQIMAIVKNVQEIYGATGRTIPNPNVDITGALDSQGLLPNDTVITSGYVHAMGGTLVVTGITSTIMRVSLRQVPQDACVNLLVKFPTLAPELKVRRIAVAGVTLATVNADNVDNPSGGVDLPTGDPVTASAWCNSSDNNEVQLDFSMR